MENLKRELENTLQIIEDKDKEILRLKEELNRIVGLLDIDNKSNKFKVE